MKLSNSAPLAAAGLLIATMAGCSDFQLQNLEGNGDDEGNSSPATPNEATPNTDDEPPPPDAPPSLPGSSLLENTCFGLLSDDSLAPRYIANGEPYPAALGWIQRTRVKLGIALLQRLSHYDPEMVQDLMQEYAESGEDLTIDLAIEKIRELLAKNGVTVWWDKSAQHGWSNIYLTVGDRRKDIEEGLEEVDGGNYLHYEKNPFLIPDVGCGIIDSLASIHVNKMAPQDWNAPPTGADSISTFWSVTDFAYVLRESDPLPRFTFWPADARYCLPPDNDSGGHFQAVNGWYFPEGTICFEHDSVEYYGEGDDSIYEDVDLLDDESTQERIEGLESTTEFIIDIIGGGEDHGVAYFEGSWFEQ